MFKETEKVFWVYPKLLIVVAGCFGLTALLSRWLSSSLAVSLGFLPFFALLAFVGRPLTHQQLLFRVILIVLALAALTLILIAAKTNFAW